MKAAQIRKALLGEAATGVIPVQMLTTDRILQRWAEGSGSGLPTEEFDDTPRSRAAPLDVDTWMVVNREVETAPPSTNRIVVTWYKTPLPTEQIAKRLGYNRGQMYQALALCLNFMKYRFEGTKHVPLIKLVQQRLVL